MTSDLPDECCITVRHVGPLRGEVVVPGAKNSVLKLMAASLLTDGVFEITNVPVIVDVPIMADLLIERLGGEPFSWGGDSLADVGALRAAYIAALRAADGHDMGPLIAFARS